MPISTQYKAIKRWASNAGAARTAPDDMALTPPLVFEDGWGDTFSQDDGDTMRRAVANWLFNAVSEGLVDIRELGLLPWDADVDTKQHGWKQVAGVPYIALVDNGPTYSNAISPVAGGQTVWMRATGTTGPPGAPNAPQATAPAAGELDWFWNCPFDGGAQVTGFDFQWRRSGSGSWSGSIVVTTPRRVLTGLTNGTAYQAQVRARNAEGDGPWSTPGTATPTGTVPGGGSTLALRADGGDGQAGLDWLEPDDGGESISSYTVQWRTTNQAFSTGRQQTATTTQANVSPLTNGTEYFFQVRAVNSEGNGAWSNEASAVPAAVVADQAIPDRADAPTGEAGQGEGTWTWPAPSDNGSDITNYQFRWREVGSGTWTDRTLANIPSRTETLVNGRTYEAQTRAVNGVGAQTQYSGSGELTPQADVPDAVQIVALSNVSSGIRGDWGEPENNGASITAYTVQIANNSAFTAASSFTTANRNRTFVGLVDGTTYWVRVRASNGRGAGAYSTGVSLQRDDGIALPDAPDMPEATGRRPLLVDWAFNPSASNGAEFTAFQLQWRIAGAGWSGNVIDSDEPCARHAVPDNSTDVQARGRSRNSDGWGAWSATGSLAAADLRTPLTAHLLLENVAFAWPYDDVTDGVLTVSGTTSAQTVVTVVNCTATRLPQTTVYRLSGLSSASTISVEVPNFFGADYFVFPVPLP